MVFILWAGCCTLVTKTLCEICLLPFALSFTQRSLSPLCNLTRNDLPPRAILLPSFLSLTSSYFSPVWVFIAWNDKGRVTAGGCLKQWNFSRFLLQFPDYSDLHPPCHHPQFTERSEVIDVIQHETLIGSPVENRGGKVCFYMMLWYMFNSL